MVTATPEGVVLGLHIAAGVVALFAGVGALLTKKGGDRHRRAGRFYVRSMAIVVGAVPLLLAFDPTNFARQFLLLVAVFSGYFVFTGYRILSHKRPAAGAAPVDWLAAGLMVVACLGLGGWGLVLVLGGTQLGIVMVVFGGLGLVVGVADLRVFRAVNRRDPWMAVHLRRMIGGFIATVTAVSVVNLAGLVPDVVAWLWPTAVGVPLILYWLSKYADTGPFASADEGHAD